MRNIILTACFTLFMVSISGGQIRSTNPETTPDHISALALAAPTRIVLRWAPSSARAWDHANKVGYVVDRVRIDQSGEPVRTGTGRITPRPLTPWTLEEWKQKANRENIYAAIAAQALYGKSFVPQTTDPIAQMKNMSDELQNRFSFSLFAADIDSSVASGMGLRIVDEDIKPGTEYLYNIFVAQQPEDFKIDSSYVLVRAKSAPRASAPDGLQLTPGDGQIRLTWEISTLGNKFSGYWVVRSDDGGRSYHRLHNRPLVFLRISQDARAQPLFTDTTVVNYKTYRYRVYGITPFATFSQAAQIEGYARDLTPPPAPILLEGKNVRESIVQLRWNMEETAADLHGFRIGISNQPDGPFEVDMQRLLRPEIRQSLDSRAISAMKNYYVVIAVDTADNAAASMPLYVHLIDTIPPARPIGLYGKADTSGIVTLRWRLGSELDLMGYRVYMANQVDHEFNLLTGFPVLDTVFVDTVQIRSITKDVYYKIVALDRNYNPSAPTEILRVRLPDIVPPVAPVFKSVTPTESSVLLTWIPSSSKDVQRHFLLRRVVNTSKWNLINILDHDTRQYEDRNVTPKTMYEYSVVAQDRSGLRSSFALPVQARPYDTGKRSGVMRLRAVPDTTRKVIRLSWSYPNPGSGKYWFVIYRSVGGEPLMRYRSAGQRLQFEDQDIWGWEKFEYAVQVMYHDGGRSTISQPVQMVYRPRKGYK
jgi:hypothetical protein